MATWCVKTVRPYHAYSQEHASFYAIQRLPLEYTKMIAFDALPLGIKSSYEWTHMAIKISEQNALEYLYNIINIIF